MGGDVPVQQGQLDNAFLGPAPWGKHNVFILPDSGVNQSAGFQGFLGVAALKARRVGFDPIHEVFAWENKNGLMQLAARN